MNELAEEVLRRLMAYDVEGQIGAYHDERNVDLTTQRNGYRHRASNTRLDQHLAPAFSLRIRAHGRSTRSRR